MATTMRAGDVTLHDLGARFGLQLIKDATFFPEWHTELPEISEQEKQQLDRIQASYLHLVSQMSMVEDVVKMVVCRRCCTWLIFSSPLFPSSQRLRYSSQLPMKSWPLRARSTSWCCTINCGSCSSNRNGRRPRLRWGSRNCWRYMLASPNPVQPVYGMITNGGSFVFLKLVQGPDAAHYALSRIFEMRNPGNDLYPVLAVLKHLKHLVLQKQTDVR